MDTIKTFQELKGIIDELCKEDRFGSPTWLAHLDRGIDQTSSFIDHDVKLSSGIEDGQLSEFESRAVDLWNLSVASKTKGSITVPVNAKLRHIAFFALHLISFHNQTENGLRRQVMMGLKSSRAWLDCSKPMVADAVLEITMRTVHSLKEMLEKKAQEFGHSEEMRQKQELDMDQDIFSLLCYRAEAMVAQSCPEDGLKMIYRAKEFLHKLPKEAGLLSMLCYNLGVELYQKKMLIEAVIWLRESFELGKGKQALGTKNQARTLRLLANIYLELDPVGNLQKAKNAVNLANTEHSHPAGLFLCLKISLLGKESDETIRAALEDIFKQQDLTVELSLHVLQEVNQHKRLQIVTWAIEMLLKKFHNSPDIGKLLITNLEVLLQGGLLAEAKEFVEYCITAHHTGRSLDFSIKKRFQTSLWQQASEAVESGDHAEAAQWFNYCLSLYSKSDPGDLNMAKLHRNRANCYIALNNLDKAKEAICEAEKCDPTSAKTWFISYKLSLLENDNERACESLKRLCDCAQAVDTTDRDGMEGLTKCELVALAAQHALESDKLQTASTALEYLSTNSPDFTQVFTALRCLVRLKLTAADGDSTNRSEVADCISYIRTAAQKLESLKSNRDTSMSGDIRNEADWFRKIAWNLALQNDGNPETMKDLFCLCSKLISMCSSDEAMKLKEVTCQLMSAAALLQLARGASQGPQQRVLLEECLEHISSCRKIHTQIKEQSIGNTKCRDTEVLMLLYEFEARIKLKDPGVENILEQALTLPNPDPKTFETLAGIALESPAYNKNVCVRAIRVAVRKHLQCLTPDITACSKLFHSLIQLSLSGVSAQDLAGKEEAWNYYTEIFDVLDKFSQSNQFPEIEIVWLMSKAWNSGIGFYSSSRFPEAEKWCGMSMRMLKYLQRFKNSYQDHMSNIYAEILAKVPPSGTGQTIPVDFS